MKRQGEQSGVFARTVILQHAKRLAAFAHRNGNFTVERLVHTTLQGALVQADLAEHPRDRRLVQRLAAMLAERDGDLALVKAEPVSRAHCYERQRLKRLRRRTQVRDHLRRAEPCDHTPIRVTRDDVPAMARLRDRTASHLDERRGCERVRLLYLAHWL